MINSFFKSLEYTPKSSRLREPEQQNQSQVGHPQNDVSESIESMLGKNLIRAFITIPEIHSSLEFYW